MTGRTTTIRLDGVDYTVPRFNIGQLERVAEAGNNAWAVLRIALERSSPQIADVTKLEPEMDEISIAFRQLIKLQGVKEAEGNPPQEVGL